MSQCRFIQDKLFCISQLCVKCTIDAIFRLIHRLERQKTCLDEIVICHKDFQENVSTEMDSKCKNSFKCHGILGSNSELHDEKKSQHLNSCNGKR